MPKRVSAYLSDQAVKDLALIIRYFQDDVGITLRQSTAIDVAIRKAAEGLDLKGEPEEEAA